MRTIIVNRGQVTPTTTTTPVTETQAPLRAKSPKQRATKALMISRIKAAISRAQEHIKGGDRKLISPEAMIWVERPVPSDTNTLDVLRGIKDILEKGVPPLKENPQLVENTRTQLAFWYQRAKDLWAVGAGGQLPRTAYDADHTLKSEPLDKLSISQMQALIKDLGGNL